LPRNALQVMANEKKICGEWKQEVRDNRRTKKNAKLTS